MGVPDTTMVDIEKIRAEAREEGRKDAEAKERKVNALELGLRFIAGAVIGFACAIGCGTSVGCAAITGLVVGSIFAIGIGTALLIALGGC